MRYLIPIAATDDLFPLSEFHFPKPLIEVDGVPMISRCIASIRSHDADADFIFIVRQEDYDGFSFGRLLELDTDGRCRVIPLKTSTKGAACSALMAVDHIDDDDPLVICNGDQVLDTDIIAATDAFERQGLEAGVICFPSVHPRWSYVRTDVDGQVVEAAEKRVLSRRAIAGFYYFRHGRDFVQAALNSIRNGAAVGRKYYIAPTLNEIILSGGRVGCVDIREDQYHSFYSPQRLEYYQRHLGTTKRKAPPAKPLQILIPMAGLGRRFAQAGYTKPKPFIDVAGKAMVERVMDNLHIDGARYILIARSEHLAAEPDIIEGLKRRGDVAFVSIDLTTEGAACTVLTARATFDPEAPLLIANCDQIVDFDCAAYVRDAQSRALDGSILCFHDVERDPKWSFARLGEHGLVDEVREKVAISDMATVGLYWFRRADIFLNAAIDMICRNDRVNGEFYVCPVYNYAIAQGARIGIHEVPAAAMHGVGTPHDLDRYLDLLVERAQ